MRAGAASAQSDFPNRPVKILVPFAAGGPTDVVARILADLLAARWGGQSVIVEDRPGAGTIVATAATAKAPADGYTMLLATNSILINPAIGQKLPYDTLKELTGISMVATQPVALVASKSFPANTVEELVRLVKARTEPLNFTSPGPRGVGHLAGAMLMARAGITMTHINYNGSAPALTDVIAGRVPVMFDIWHSAKRYVASGDLKLIASASAERFPDAPQAPTIAETYPGFAVAAMNAMYGPAGIPGSDPAKTLGRHPRRRRLARVFREGQEPRHRRQGQHAAATRRLDPRRDRELGGDCQGGEHQGG